MSHENQVEIEATQRIRRRHPEVGQRTLARRIKLCGFGDSTEDAVDARRTKFAPEATIYNRIRRFDKQQKQEPVGVGA